MSQSLKLQVYTILPFVFAIGLFISIPNSINFESIITTIILLIAFLLAVVSVYAGKIYGQFLVSYAKQNNLEENLPSLVKSAGVILRVIAIPFIMLSYFWYRLDASSSLLWLIFKWIIILHAILSFMRGVESCLSLSFDSGIFQGKYFLGKEEKQRISNINKIFQSGMVFLLIFCVFVLMVLFSVNRNYTEHVYKAGSVMLVFVVVIIGIRLFKNYR